MPKPMPKPTLKPMLMSAPCRNCSHNLNWHIGGDPTRPCCHTGCPCKTFTATTPAPESAFTPELLPFAPRHFDGNTRVFLDADDGGSLFTVPADYPADRPAFLQRGEPAEFALYPTTQLHHRDTQLWEVRSVDGADPNRLYGQHVDRDTALLRALEAIAAARHNHADHIIDTRTRNGHPPHPPYRVELDLTGTHAPVIHLACTCTPDTLTGIIDPLHHFNDWRTTVDHAQDTSYQQGTQGRWTLCPASAMPATDDETAAALNVLNALTSHADIPSYSFTDHMHTAVTEARTALEDPDDATTLDIRAAMITLADLYRILLPAATDLTPGQLATARRAVAYRNSVRP